MDVHGDPACWLDRLCSCGAVIEDEDAPCHRCGLHPIGRAVAAAAGGEFAPPDGAVRVVPPVQAHVTTVLAMTGHAIVATERTRAEVLARAPDAFGGAHAPAFLLWLAGDDGEVGSVDAVLVARGTGAGGGTLQATRELDDHPRVRHARALRDDVVVHGDDRGLVTVGRGIGGLRELSVELVGATAGVGRDLIRDALGLVAHDDLVVAAVAPGNARSLRAFLSVGFVPVGAAVQISLSGG